MGVWYWIVEEFRALGLHCLAHGPEFWLGVAAICGVTALSIAVGFCIWRGDKK